MFRESLVNRDEVVREQRIYLFPTGALRWHLRLRYHDAGR